MLDQDEDPEFGLQIAPLLDLLFVLLLFFMVSVGSRNQESELGIHLAASHPATNAAQPPPVITLRIDQLGQVYWNDLPVGSATSPDLTELQARLTDKVNQPGEQPAVVVVPDPHTRQERLIDVLNAANAAHIRNLTLGEITR
jgi:biopolymer transport protein ExbD